VPAPWRPTGAQRTDERHLAWKAGCDRVAREWQVAMNTETDDDRFAGLVAFAAPTDAPAANRSGWM
jgi:hypothetical protein